jgi:hypothetical protein
MATAMRGRHANVNPPPTPEWRARNTKIMTVPCPFVSLDSLGSVKPNEACSSFCVIV